MTPLHQSAADWLDPVIVPFVEAPPRRRMARAFRQCVDFQVLRVEDTTRPENNPAVYGVDGNATTGTRRTGRLLNVRV